MFKQHIPCLKPLYTKVLAKVEVHVSEKTEKMNVINTAIGGVVIMKPCIILKGEKTNDNEESTLLNLSFIRV